MTTYHFDCGDSNNALLGLCAEVEAKDPRHAVAKLRAALENLLSAEGALRVHSDQAGIGYINVYVNTDHLSVHDADSSGTQ